MDFFNEFYTYHNTHTTENIINFLFSKTAYLQDSLEILIHEDKLRTQKHILINESIDNLYHMSSEYKSDVYLELLLLFSALRQYINKTTLDLKARQIKEHKIYNIIVGDIPYKIRLFGLYCIIYYLESYFNVGWDYVCIDFEFNHREIALMQINFELKNKDSFIFIINPSQFETATRHDFIKYIMKANIFKILHGSDSLDIPYLYEVFFQNNPKTIIKFTRYLIDTRFLCEYRQAIDGKSPKCSLYDAMLYFKVISQKKYDELNQIQQAMGPVQDVAWKVAQLSKAQLTYALYDVVFLKKFYLALVNTSDKQVYSYLKALTRFLFLERRGVTKILIKMKSDTDAINNYIIKRNDQNETLISIYNQVIENLEVEGIKIKNLQAINYFKIQIGIMLKKIVYTVLTNKYTVNSDKKTVFNQKLDMKTEYTELKNLKFKRVLKFMEALKKTLTAKL